MQQKGEKEREIKWNTTKRNQKKEEITVNYY